ncbi:4-coumarate--CoA ligase-like 9 isoform X1 [Gossypium hirsutum]|uniref:4-coumarate--CoA ligase-like 9 isoform X1 n=1 Tax=Gossypium hirsutum TaxID=3635 RepID=A0ABM3B767_GOSHI|nr:4-coumarate--CoA ligase-like 9 isoform X1 [Gossypium hirsutum]
MATLVVDPNSGFCSKTMTFHSLRSPVSLPPESAPISFTDFFFFMLQSSPPSPTAVVLIDATTRRRILHTELIFRFENLVTSLRTHFGLSKGDCAVVFTPNNIFTPILYLSLLSIGVVISPVNPAATAPEIHHLIRHSKPVIAFASSDSAHKIPLLKHGVVAIDSVEFESLMESPSEKTENRGIKVNQSDVATILYSSGTTGGIKGVALTHRNLTAAIAGGMRPVRSSPTVVLCTVPFFHVYGLVFSLRSMVSGDCMVITGGSRSFGLRKMYGVIYEYRVSLLALAPPLIVKMVNDTAIMDGYDLSSLEAVLCGGAHLSKSMIQRLRKRLPKVKLAQAYGLTETTGRVFSTMVPDETQAEGATGKLMPNCEAKIVDPETGAALPPAKPGELWVRGPLVMRGYVDNEEATVGTLDSDGWLRTGDLCYINNEGFLFFVDRIKELIKYKGYQVAPAELEHLLNSHPDVVESAVVPLSDEEAGQVPVAFVVRQSGSNIDESKLKHFVAQQACVSPYKRIRRIMFIDSLPKNASGKVMRKELVIKLSSATSKL